MKTKKSKIYQYSFFFKKGDYLGVSSTLQSKFSKYFTGSGMSLLDGAYDISFSCSPEQAQKITRYIKQNLPWAANFVRERAFK